jgi:hypothetical protein
MQIMACSRQHAVDLPCKYFQFIHLPGSLGVILIWDLMRDCVLDALPEQSNFRESSSTAVHPSHSNCLEFGTIIFSQGVQHAHDYVLIFIGEVLLVAMNFLGSSLLQCGPMARLYDQVHQHLIHSLSN